MLSSMNDPFVRTLRRKTDATTLTRRATSSRVGVVRHVLSPDLHGTSSSPSFFASHGAGISRVCGLSKDRTKLITHSAASGEQMAPPPKLALLETMLHADLDELERLLDCDFCRDSGSHFVDSEHYTPAGRRSGGATAMVSESTHVDEEAIQHHDKTIHDRHVVGIRPSSAAVESREVHRPPKQLPISEDSGSAAIALAAMALQLSLIQSELDALDTEVHHSAVVGMLLSTDAEAVRQRLDAERRALAQRYDLLNQASELLSDKSSKV